MGAASVQGGDRLRDALRRQVQGVYVDPEHRGEGLSVSGMAAVVEMARRDIAPVVSLYLNAHNLARPPCLRAAPASPRPRRSRRSCSGRGGDTQSAGARRGAPLGARLLLRAGASPRRPWTFPRCHRGSWPASAIGAARERGPVLLTHVTPPCRRCREMGPERAASGARGPPLGDRRAHRREARQRTCSAGCPGCRTLGSVPPGPCSATATYPSPGGCRVVHTPGHSPGHVSFLTSRPAPDHRRLGRACVRRGPLRPPSPSRPRDRLGEPTTTSPRSPGAE